MKELENDKGFKVLMLSDDECKILGGNAVCDHCNIYSKYGLYVAVLNHWICPFCYKDWIERAKRYKEDIPIEEKNYNRISLIIKTYRSFISLLTPNNN